MTLIPLSLHISLTTSTFHFFLIVTDVKLLNPLHVPLLLATVKLPCAKYLPWLTDGAKTFYSHLSVTTMKLCYGKCLPFSLFNRCETPLWQIPSTHSLLVIACKTSLWQIPSMQQNSLSSTLYVTAGNLPCDQYFPFSTPCNRGGSPLKLLWNFLMSNTLLPPFLLTYWIKKIDTNVPVHGLTS